MDEEAADKFMRDLSEEIGEPRLTLRADFQEFCANVHDILTVAQAAESWARRA